MHFNKLLNRWFGLLCAGVCVCKCERAAIFCKHMHGCVFVRVSEWGWELERRDMPCTTFQWSGYAITNTGRAQEKHYRSRPTIKSIIHYKSATQAHMAHLLLIVISPTNIVQISVYYLFYPLIRREPVGMLLGRNTIHAKVWASFKKKSTLEWQTESFFLFFPVSTFRRGCLLVPLNQS